MSVIIPAYNASRYIGEALDSVFAQTFKDYETVVVNDGSADTPALEQVLAAYDDRIVYLKQENQGVSKARNTGIHYARGQFIALLDSDDRWEPGFLQQQVSMFQSNPNLDLVFSDSILFGATPLNGRRFMSVYPSSRPVTLAKLLNGDATVITSCVVARKTALLEAGLFDETRHYSEDFDLWCRMAAIGKQIDFSPNPSAGVALEPESQRTGLPLQPMPSAFSISTGHCRASQRSTSASSIAECPNMKPCSISI